MKVPLVSVVIPNYNYGRFLESTLMAIEEQTYPSCEVIVVDDGSTDNSVDLVRNRFPKVKLVVQNNKGVNSARNAGIKFAQGDLIALCDADDLWLPTKLQKQVPLFSKLDTILVGSQVEQFVENSGDVVIIRAQSRGNLRRKYMRAPGTAWIPGPCSSAVFQKTVALNVGLFNEALRGSAEDWEFFARLSAEGDFDFVDEVLVKVRKHNDSRSAIRPRNAA